MRPQHLAVSVPKLLVIGLGLVVLLTLVVSASTSGTAFGTYNPAWDGGNDLRTTAEEHDSETSVVTNATQYEQLDGNGTVAFVIAPDEPYDNESIAHLQAFLDRGGTIVIADDRPEPANSAMAALGSETRIDGAPLRDERTYERSPEFPVATPTSDHRYTNGVETLTLNHGSALITENATVLAHSSEYAYLDRNRSGELESNETMAVRPIVTAESVDSGKLVVISDPSIFINVMLEYEGNQAFADGLISSHEQVAFDVSHTNPPPPLQAALLEIRNSALLQLLLGVGALGAITAWERNLWDRFQRSESRFAPREQAVDRES